MSTLIRRTKRLAHNAYDYSPREMRESRALKRLYREHDVTPDFLRSQHYRDHMALHTPCTGDYGLHEAQTMTLSFKHRHQYAHYLLGAFRWRGFQEHLDTLLEIIATSGLVVDLGGAAGPIGLGTEVVDTLPSDRRGRPIRYRSIEELSEAPGAVISSHTFEHIPNLDGVIREIAAALRPGGVLVAHVPGFTCERWRVGEHANATYGDHVWTFGLSGTSTPAGLRRYAAIDQMIAQHLGVVSAAYTGDDSILVVARKP